MALTPEHYNRIARLMEHNIPVKLQFNIQNQFFEDQTDSVNVVAEIPGNAKKDEIVMLGAHLDSWHGGTGATDNAAGSAVVMEAARILKTLNLKMDRTVRMALWGGEEEGLLGSKAYVKEHFADRETMKLTAEHAKLAGYFNYDNGTGKIRGIYLQGNDMARPIFEAWLEPFKDLGATSVTIRNTGGTDHQSFDAVGLPGFQFIQDPHGLQHAHASFQHGCVRSRASRRSDAGVGDHGVVRVQHRHAGGDVAAQAVAEAAAGTAAGGTDGIRLWPRE